MAWKRGLLLAAVNIVVAVPLIIMQEAQDWQYMRTWRQTTSHVQFASFQEGTVAWDPTTINWYVPPRARVVQITNFPAFILSGWHNPARGSFTLAGRIEASLGRVNRKASIWTSTGFTLLIFLQWLLVGSVPITRPKRKVLEPGALITLCGALSGATLVSTTTEAFYGIPIIIVLIAWFVWFGAAVVKTTKATWKFVRSEISS